MKLDIINLIIISIMFLSAIGFMFWYNQNLINQCTSNPLVFASKQLENQYGREFFGVGYFRTEQGGFPIITFNSTEATIQ